METESCGKCNSAENRVVDYIKQKGIHVKLCKDSFPSEFNGSLRLVHRMLEKHSFLQLPGQCKRIFVYFQLVFQSFCFAKAYFTLLLLLFERLNLRLNCSKVLVPPTKHHLEEGGD